MKRTQVALLALTGMAFLWTGTRVAAQSSNWSKPVQLSSEERSAWFSDLAVGPNGSVHVVWSSTKPREGKRVPYDVLMYRYLRDGVWSPMNDIANPGAAGAVVRHSLVVGYDGRLHVLARSDTRIEHISAPADKSLSVGNWTAPRNISGGKNTVYYNALGMDSQGRLHAVWTEIVPLEEGECQSCSDVFYRNSSDGGQAWSSPINLSQTLLGTDKPHLKIDRYDHIHVVWDEGQDRFANTQPNMGEYRRSTDGGATWSQPITFTLRNDTVEQTTLALTQEGNPFVVYRATRSAVLYYQFSTDNGLTWSEPTPLPGIRARSANDTPYDGFTMTTDGAGRIHLIVVGFLAGELGVSDRPRLLHLTWDGSNWSAPEVIVNDGLYPEWPRAVVSGGDQLHLTWFTRNEKDRYDTEKSQYRVWYSHRSLDAPTVTPVPSFTPTVTPSPTPLPQVTAVATPQPTLDQKLRIYPAPDGPPDLDNGSVLVLVLSGIPVLTLAAAVWVVRRVRAR